MPQIDPVYDRLSLADKYIVDHLLMALAWKKSHEYIRNANWYADNFELDKSALNLAELCNQWSGEIGGKLKFADLRLVPAPKSAEWIFAKGADGPDDFSNLLAKDFADIPDFEDPGYCVNWQPKDSEKVKLRPLAHIGIREQSYMTLLMMCLANDVEEIQGDPSLDYGEVHEKNMVSYGNRLYCTYLEDGKAEHNYGATTTYGKYFTDYRKFLQRPYYFASKSLPEKSHDEEVYLVDLDLTQFFDLINRKILVKKIDIIAKGMQGVTEDNYSLASKLLKSFERWTWSPCAEENYGLCRTENVSEPPQGLPQGLVASGFLSNIYMLDFDDDMSQFIGHAIPGIEDDDVLNLKLVDYCRYVDDMRLVLVGPGREKNGGKNPIPKIQKTLNRWLESKLSDLKLKLHPEKTKVEVYRGRSKGISAALEEIQNRGSGPVAHDDAEEIVSQLESLLMLSGKGAPTQDCDNCRINRLSLIEKNVFDVREDTLKRFAANKISRMLNSIRHFTARAVDDSGNSIAGDWDYRRVGVRSFI